MISSVAVTLIMVNSPTAALGAETASFAYDALGRLTGSAISAGPSNGATTALQYDPAGNRINFAVTGSNNPAPVDVLISLPLNGLSILPVITPTNVGQPAPPATSVSFAVTGPGTVSEGQSAVFTITKSTATNVALTVAYATANGSATSSRDYQAQSGTLSFQGWETAKTVAVPVLVDSVSEGAETFSMALSSPSNGSTIAVASATATIAANTVNAPPVANTDTLSLGVCTYAEKNVVANDTDPDGNLPLEVVSVATGAPLGEVHVVNATTLGFTAAGAAGSQSITYTVRDSLGGTATGSLNVTVTAGSGCQ